MKKYRLTMLGKIVTGSLLLIVVSAVAYGFQSDRGYAGGLRLSMMKQNKVQGMVQALATQKPEPVTAIATTSTAVDVPKRKAMDQISATEASKADEVKFNLKEFLQYMPMTTETVSSNEEKIIHNNVEIFYAPHPDDELLSMGAAIAQSVKKGNEVHLVLYTHGYESNAIHCINGTVYCPWHKRMHSPEQEGYDKLTSQDVGKLRIKEFENSAVGLGVKKENMHILNFNADSMSAYETMLIMLGFEKQYPGAMHCTASYHDRHPFHQKVGQGMLRLFNNKDISRVRFFISPIQWNSEKGTTISGEDFKEAIEKSENAYSDWNPKHQQYGIGYHSYPQPFIKLKQEYMSKYHGPNE